MTTSRRRFLTLASATLAAPAIARQAFAADWPKDKIIKVIIPFSPGASTDILGRIITDKLSQRLGQTMVVENRGGAGGSIGALQVARAEPDGYTLLINAAAHTIAPAVYKNLTYDAANDFAGVAMLGSVPNVLLVSSRRGYKTVKDLVDKAKTGEMTFSSSGVGSASHWAAERFRVSAGFKATHVPYRGGLESLTEVITDRIDFCCIGVSAAVSFIKDGQAKALCVTTKKRSPFLPDVVTSLEAGYPNSDFNFWNGILAPAKTPKAIIERLHAETTAVLAMSDVQEKLAVQGLEPSPAKPAEFDAQIRQEIAENIRIAKQANVQQN